MSATCRSCGKPTEEAANDPGWTDQWCANCVRIRAEGKIDISGIDKAELLAALYNGTRAYGMGLLMGAEKAMTVEDARAYLRAGDDGSRNFPEFARRNLYFDYCQGRPIKSDISGDTLDPRLYDRDAGEGRAAEVVAQLRAKAVQP